MPTAPSRHLTAFATLLLAACAARPQRPPSPAAVLLAAPEVTEPAPRPCADATVAGDEVLCGGKPWARVIRAACAPPERFPATAYLWPDELACRGLAVEFADGIRFWAYKAPSLDVAFPDRYTPPATGDGEAETAWIARAVLTPDAATLRFHVGGPIAYELVLATREVRRAREPRPDPRVRYVTFDDPGARRPGQVDPGCFTTKVAARFAGGVRGPIPESLIVKFAVAEDGTPARYELVTNGEKVGARVVAGVWESVRACRWTPARDAGGRPFKAFVILPIRFAGR